MTKIEWAEETWNPTTGCNKVSRGCKHCYAEKQHARMMHMHPKKYTKAFLDGVEMHWDELDKPLRWDKPRRIFIDSMSDLFHDDVTDDFLHLAFSVMASAKDHQFLILTKRPERMQKFVSGLAWTCGLCIWSAPSITSNIKDVVTPRSYILQTNCIGVGEEYPASYVPPNIWLGVSCENQEAADKRIPLLLKTPAAIRFLSCEPLVGPIRLAHTVCLGCGRNKDTHDCDCPAGTGTAFNYKKPDDARNHWGIDWVIVGGESGNDAEPMHPDWARTLRDQCKEAGVKFFFKQWGKWLPNAQCPAEEAGPGLGDPMEYFPDMDAYDRDLEKYREWIDKNMIKVHDWQFYNYGKHKSGRMLDGVEHSEYPEVKNKQQSLL